MHLRRAELSVIQQKSSLGSGFLLEGYDGRLCLFSIGRHRQVADLSTFGVSARDQREARSYDQKLKKSRTSFSVVSLAMLLTWTVVAMFLREKTEEMLRNRSGLGVVVRDGRMVGDCLRGEQQPGCATDDVTLKRHAGATRANLLRKVISQL
jgi:hypothetical protein